MELHLCAHCHVVRVRRKSQIVCSRTCANASRGRPVTERFLDYCQPGEPDACWPFTGTLHHGRYGVLTGKNNRQFFAHRIAYERAKGPIPAGLYVCHTCDNPPCCNPAHLFVGSSRDNTRDMIQKGRSRVIGAHGETNPAHKLTENDVRMIRALYPRLSQVAIARRFRINQTIVSDIVRREIWKHVA